jgi:type VI secretion system protein ImpC
MPQNESSEAEAEAPVESADPVSPDEQQSVLDTIFEQVQVDAPGEEVEVEEFKDPDAVARKDRGAMVSAALRVFLDAVSEQEQPVDQIDKYLFDRLISSVDQKISEQLDEIVHHDAFQQLESAWRELKFLVDRTDFRQNVEIEVLNVSKEALRASFEDAPELVQSPMYEHVYTNAFDQPGADPYGAIVSGYEFDNSPEDIALMRNVSKVAASAHCPFIGAVGPAFFGKDSMEEWKKIPDLTAYMETAEYTQWNAFRQTEDARYLGLTFPRFMLRLPYGEDTVSVNNFNYEEDVKGEDHGKYLWGTSTFTFGANMVEAFMDDGWCVQIRGPQSGGKVRDLPVHMYDAGRGNEMKIPTEVPISETLEFECSKLGFMPLSHYQGEDYAVFFSANSTQQPKEYDDEQATANSRVNARLPYIFLASRISHYLKVLQRENIGATKNRRLIEDELNEWLSRHVTEMPNPSPEQIAKYPLRKGEVRVEEATDNPGFFKVDTMIMPHFQIEGMDISLSLVSKMPKEE